MEATANAAPTRPQKVTRKKDDLFENSTMTFGEHLEELRQCLVRAIIALGVGLAVGLTVANEVVRYVAVPLKSAIVDFNAKKNLTLLGYDDLDDPSVQRLLPLMKERSLKWQIVYEIPEKLQNLTPKSLEPAKLPSAAGGSSAGGSSAGGSSAGGRLRASRASNRQTPISKVPPRKLFFRPTRG